MRMRNQPQDPDAEAEVNFSSNKSIRKKGSQKVTYCQPQAPATARPLNGRFTHYILIETPVED